MITKKLIEKFGNFTINFFSKGHNSAARHDKTRLSRAILAACMLYCKVKAPLLQYLLCKLWLIIRLLINIGEANEG